MQDKGPSFLPCSPWGFFLLACLLAFLTRKSLAGEKRLAQCRQIAALDEASNQENRSSLSPCTHCPGFLGIRSFVSRLPACQCSVHYGGGVHRHSHMDPNTLTISPPPSSPSAPSRTHSRSSSSSSSSPSSLSLHSLLLLYHHRDRARSPDLAAPPHYADADASCSSSLVYPSRPSVPARRHHRRGRSRCRRLKRSRKGIRRRIRMRIHRLGGARGRCSRLNCDSHAWMRCLSVFVLFLFGPVITNRT